MKWGRRVIGWNDDLNMVRAGVVRHPGEWRWTGYHELMGMRKRYRVLDMDRLFELLGGRKADEFRKNYEVATRDAASARGMSREGKWTGSLAVGSEAFVKDVGAQIANRMKVDILEEPVGAGVWTVREA